MTKKNLAMTKKDDNNDNNNNNNNNNDSVTSTMDALSNMITPLLGGVGPERPIASCFYPFPDFPP